MINENNAALDMLVKRLYLMIQEETQNLKYDKTFKSVVWGINDDGTYQISYMNQIYNVPNALGTKLSLGQGVWVKIPCGIFRNLHICGVRDKNRK